MEVVPLMIVAKGEEDHQEYKEVDGNHCEHVFIL